MKEENQDGSLVAFAERYQGPYSLSEAQMRLLMSAQRYTLFQGRGLRRAARGEPREPQHKSPVTTKLPPVQQGGDNAR